KDGTLIENVPFNVDPARIRLQPGALGCLKTLAARGYALVVVTNQSGVALGHYSLPEVQCVKASMTAQLAEQGVTLDGFYFCPHHPAGTVQPFAIECDCRKPNPGLLL